MNKKQLAVISAVLGLGLLLASFLSRGAFDGHVSQLKIDLNRPDVLIKSQKIAALPRDLVALPGLRDVLTADFVNYYEDHPERLSLEGSLRRLAFEHGLTWQDRLLSAVLDAPAELALWRDGKGRLAYAAISLDKNAAASTLEQLAKVVLPDSQLSLAGSISLDGNSAKVLALRVSGSSSWLMVSTSSRLLVLTHPGMLLDADKRLSSKSVEAIQAVLTGKKQPWLADMASPSATTPSLHAITAKMSWLSFGYQHFFPDLHALRLDLDDKASWRLSVAARPSVWPDWTKSAVSAWGVLPRGSSLCAALPVKWDQSRSLLEDALGKDKSKALVVDLETGAAVCWYPGQGLYSPSLALQFKPSTGAKHDASLKLLMEKSLKTAKGKPAIIATQKLVAGHTVWTAAVPSPYGYLKAGNDNVHRVSLMRRGDALIASLDHRAIDQALAVASKTYPALADDVNQAGAKQPPLLVSELPELGRLLQNESLRLTQSTPAFQALVRTRLKPRLDGMGQNGRLMLSAADLPQSGTTGIDKQVWVWQTLALTTVPALGATSAPAASKPAAQR